MIVCLGAVLWDRAQAAAYNDAILATSDGQLLKNIVRLRFVDSIGFLAVSSVTANVSVTAAGSANPDFPEPPSLAVDPRFEEVVQLAGELQRRGILYWVLLAGAQLPDIAAVGALDAGVHKGFCEDKGRNTMRRKTIAVMAMVLLPLFGLMSCAPEAPKKEAPKPAGPSAQEAINIATDAYIFGYPLVTMEMTRRVLTNVAAPEAQKAPMGQFARLREYPTPANREVTAPNADTLYTLAWLDVSREPWVLSIPDMKDRYFLLPMLSGWTDVFQVPGKRTTGTRAQIYAITGPGWKGTLPEGVTGYKLPTGMVWILGRIYCTGSPGDFKAVHALQDRFDLVPLSAYGKPYTPPEGRVDPNIDMKTAVREQVHKLDAGAYFKLLAELMKTNPPTREDLPMLDRMARIGIVPGKDFDMGKLDPAVARALQSVPKPAQEKIMSHFKDAGTLVNGWIFSTNVGTYGTDYLQRAFITAIGLGANRPQDAVYPTSEVDADGRPYDGASKYVMRFDKGQMPPAGAFWSLTMYDDKYFFAPNRLNRYTLSSRNKLKANKDGSVDLYIQNDTPGKAREANWLPAPKGRFVLMLRLYWPKETPPSIIDGSWKPPAVKKAQ